MDRSSRSARSPAQRTWTGALLLLCAVSLWLRFHHIDATLPYPHHIDEPFVTGPAARTLLTGTLHPYTFNYPSLPKYLAAAGMAGGFVQSAARREVRDVAGIGNVGYPRYDTPGVLRGAKRLFALLSVIALAATGYAARQAAPGWPAAVFVAPLVLAASPLFFSDSWRYLNVDIVGTCFAALAVAACLRGTRDPSISRSAVLPGVLAGLAAGSKYTLALVLAPIVVAIVFYVSPGRRTLATLAAVASMLVAFVAVVPYSVIDVPGFLNGLAAEAAHYAGGHAGYEAEPGLAQLVYYTSHFVSDFGLPGMLLALVGVAACFAADWRRALVLVSFPAALLTLLASQRVHFPRNVLALHPIVSLFIAWGLLVACGWLLAWTARREWTSVRVQRSVLVAATILLLAIAIPPRHVVDQFRDRTDSRKLAERWIADELPKEWSIVLPPQLGIDPEALMTATGRRVALVDLQRATDRGALHQLLDGIPTPAVVMAPQWGADERFAGRELAAALNQVTGQWRIVATFGANPVLVNYSQPVPSGNPAFALAVLDR